MDRLVALHDERRISASTRLHTRQNGNSSNHEDENAATIPTTPSETCYNGSKESMDTEIFESALSDTSSPKSQTFQAHTNGKQIILNQPEQRSKLTRLAVDDNQMSTPRSFNDTLEVLRKYAGENEEDFETLQEESSNDEMDWEQVHVPHEDAKTAITDKPLEITIERGKGIQYPTKRKKINKELLELRRYYRQLCIDLHLTHILCHLAVGCIRNSWTNDPLIKALLLSRTPWEHIRKFRITETEPRAKSRALARALKHLVEWWSSEGFYVIGPGIEKRNFWKVHDFGIDSRQPGVSEPIQGVDILAQKILSSPSNRPLRGSSDLSAIYFAALCKAIGLPTRFVFSLQPIAWNTSLSSRKGKQKQVDDPVETATSPPPTRSLTHITSDETGISEVLNPTPSDSESKKPKRKKRGKKSVHSSEKKGISENVGGDDDDDFGLIPQYEYNRSAPPIFWVEIYSRIDTKWWAVDPIRAKVKARSSMEPAEKASNNTMTHVIAWEEDGYVRDVTRRYASHFGAYTSRLRASRQMTYGYDWWGRTLQLLERPYRLNRNDVEDAELLTNSVSEKLPGSITLYKNHPLFVLERHLRREEIIFPKQEIGRIKGEPVYSRSNVITLKTAEAYMKEGRKVKEGEHPLKSVKARTVTINKRRALEMARERAEQAAIKNGQEFDEKSLEPQTGLYAEWQTEIYVPPPVVNGIIPKNAYGNIDLYVPSMLPQGATHLPLKGVAKIAKKLGIDFADAVIGFEFKQRRAIPVIDGIVIAQENAGMVSDGYWEYEEVRAAKDDSKREEAIMKRWKKLIIALRTRHRLRSDYIRTNEQEFSEEGDHELEYVESEAAGLDGGGFIPEGQVSEGGFLRDEIDDGSGFMRDENVSRDVGYIRESPPDVQATPKVIVSFAKLAEKEEERARRQARHNALEYADDDTLDNGEETIRIDMRSSMSGDKSRKRTRQAKRSGTSSKRVNRRNDSESEISDDYASASPFIQSSPIGVRRSARVRNRQSAVSMNLERDDTAFEQKSNQASEEDSVSEWEDND